MGRRLGKAREFLADLYGINLDFDDYVEGLLKKDVRPYEIARRIDRTATVAKTVANAGWLAASFLFYRENLPHADKVAHATMGSLIEYAVTGVGKLFGRTRGIAKKAGLVSAVAGGLGYEALQSQGISLTRSSTPDPYDAASAAAGGAVGYLIQRHYDRKIDRLLDKVPGHHEERSQESIE